MVSVFSPTGYALLLHWSGAFFLPKIYISSGKLIAGSKGDASKFEIGFLFLVSVWMCVEYFLLIPCNNFVENFVAYMLQP